MNDNQYIPPPPPSPDENPSYKHIQHGGDSRLVDVTTFIVLLIVLLVMVLVLIK